MERSPAAVDCQREDASLALEAASREIVLQEAQRLLSEVLSLLSYPTYETPNYARSFALARALARTLSDQLARIVDRQGA